MQLTLEKGKTNFPQFWISIFPANVPEILVHTIDAEVPRAFNKPWQVVTIYRDNTSLFGSLSPSIADVTTQY